MFERYIKIMQANHPGVLRPAVSTLQGGVRFFVKFVKFRGMRRRHKLLYIKY